MVTFLSYDLDTVLSSLVCLSSFPALLCLPVAVVLYDMAQHTNMAKGSPTLTVASKDHRGCWRGITCKAVVYPFLADATGKFSSRGPRFLVFQVLLSESLMTRSISCDVIIAYTLGRTSS
jgi:hypothetical protein